MASIGYATLSVIPSLRGLDRNVTSQLNGQAGRAGGEAGTRFGSEFSRNASKSVSGIGSKLAAVAKGAGYVTLAALGTGAALATIGVKSAASLEQTRVAFASLLGSTKAANAQISQLQKFAAKTPFSQSDVLGYSQQYFALSHTVGLANDQVIPFLRTIGDVAAVTGASTENIHNAVMAIGQIGSAGKVTLENLNQISEAFPGFNGAAAIAAATGQKTADVLKQISAGAISAKEGIPALLKGMQDFQGASGAMAKQSKTLNGLFSTFGDTVKIKLTNAFQPLIPVVKDTLKQLTPVIGQTLANLAPAIASFTKNLAPVLAPLTQGLGQALGAIFGVLGPVLKNLAPLIEPIAKAFVRLVQAAQPLIVFLSKIIAQVGPPLIAIFSELLSALAPVVRQLTNALAPILPVIAQTLRRLAVALHPVIRALAGAFLQVIQQLAPQLPDMARSFGDLAVALAQLLTPMVPMIPLLVQMMTQFTGPTVAAITIVAKALAAMAHAAAPLASALKPLIAILGKINDLGSKAFGWIGKLASAGGALGNAFSFVSHLGGTATVIDGIGSSTLKLQGAATGAAGALNQFTIAGAAIGGIAAPLAGAFDGVAAAVTGVSLQLQKLLRNAAAALSVLGALGIPGIGGAALGAAAAAAAAGAIDTSGGGTHGVGFTLPPGGAGGGGGGGSGGSSGSKAKPGKFDRSTLSALRQALAGDAPGINSAVKSIEQSLRQAKKAIPAFLDQDATQLEKWARSRTKVAAELGRATAALKAIQQKYQSLLTSVRSAVTGSFDITTAGAHAQVFNDRAAAPTTAGSILADLVRKVASAQKFNSVLRKLRREGMPAALVQQLALAGPGALAQAQALAKSTPAQIAQFRSNYKALGTAGSDLGKFIAQDAYGAGVKTAQGLVDGLKSRKSALTKEIERLGKAMIDQLKKTLKIHSPSLVFHDIGRYAGQGLQNGMVSKYADIARAGAGMGNAAASRAAGGGGAGVIHNHEWNITQQEDPVGTATAVIRRMQFLKV